MSDLNVSYGLGARHEDHELAEERCWALLGASGVGRVGFLHEGRVAIYPVGYVVLHGSVFFRTSREGSIAKSLPQAGVSIQTDSQQPSVQAGWTVLVSGDAEAVEDAEELTRLHGLMENEPWAGGIRDLFVRVTPTGISGRQVYLAK
jgi:nitroimidazol reductase NimA-like FMN-containing flavoprotein (pyridoxamine 5'-phosphate oxidase superfamily)